MRLAHMRQEFILITKNIGTVFALPLPPMEGTLMMSPITEGLKKLLRGGARGEGTHIRLHVTIDMVSSLNQLQFLTRDERFYSLPILSSIFEFDARETKRAKERHP